MTRVKKAMPRPPAPAPLPSTPAPAPTLAPAALTVPAAAGYLSCSTRTLYSMISRGDIKSIIVGERLRRVLRSDLDAYLAELAAEAEAV